MNTNLNMQTTALSLLREIFAPSAFFSVFSEEVSVTLPDDLKGATTGIIGADGSVKTRGRIACYFQLYKPMLMR